MATSYTTRLGLQKPGTTDRNWDIPLNANSDLLDTIAPISALFVAPSEYPSSSLNVQISSGTFRKSDGTFSQFAGLNPLSVPASATTFLWLTEGGSIASGTAFPQVNYVPLAIVVTGGTSVVSITDARAHSLAGASQPNTLTTAGGTIVGALGIQTQSSGRSVFLCDPTAGTLSFFGVPGATQAASSANLIDQTNGVSGANITDVSTSYTQATLNANFASLTAKVNAILATLKSFGLMSNP
jgi:hypothetical protein